jgi:hypothetical protein
LPRHSDAATEHLRGLSNLKSYYAGKTQITDRSLALSGDEFTERLMFWETEGITDTGVRLLTRCHGSAS